MNEGSAAFAAMNAHLDLDPTPEPVAAHEPLRRRGSIVLVLLGLSGATLIASSL